MDPATVAKAAVGLIPSLCKGIVGLIQRLSSKERPLTRLLQLCDIASRLATLEINQAAQPSLDAIACLLGQVKTHLEGVEKDPSIKKKWQGWRKRSVIEGYVVDLATLIDDFLKLQNLNVATPLWAQFVHQSALKDWLHNGSLFLRGFDEPTAIFERSLKGRFPKASPEVVSDFVAKLSQGADTISIETLATLNDFEETNMESLMQALIARGTIKMEWMCMVCEYQQNIEETCKVCQHGQGTSRIKLTLFLGNVGAGKSTLANLLLSEYSLRFGAKYAVDSVTQRFQFAPGRDGWFIGDTPGLDHAPDEKSHELDAKRPEIQRIALQIELALSDSVDLYRLCFVIYPRGGRLAEMDVWTLKAIVRAVAAPKYYIIVNQVDPNHDSQYRTAFSNKLMVALASGQALEGPQDILFIPSCELEELQREQQSRLMEFVTGIPGQPLLANQSSGQPTVRFQGKMPTVVELPSNAQLARARAIESAAKQEAEKERSKNEKRVQKMNQNLKASLQEIVKKGPADDPRVRAAADLLADVFEGDPNNEAKGDPNNEAKGDPNNEAEGDPNNEAEGNPNNEDIPHEGNRATRSNQGLPFHWKDVTIILLVIALGVALCK